MPTSDTVKVVGENSVVEVTSNGEIKKEPLTPREKWFSATRNGNAYVADTQLQEGINDDVSVKLANNSGAEIEICWLNPFSTVLTSWELRLNPTTSLANNATTRQVASGWSTDDDVDFTYEIGTTLSGGTATGIDILSRAQKDREWIYAPISVGGVLGAETNVQNLSGDDLQFSIGYISTN